MNNIKILSLLVTIVLVTLSSCKDDDYSQQLDYTICVDEIVQEDDRSSQEIIEVGNWPTEIRSYFTTEFSGFAIATIISYKNVNDTKYYLLEATNGGQLLFDDTLNFICGDNIFQVESGRDDDGIAPENLPQIILDYIETNYPGVGIDEAELEDNEYEVELKNGVELCFDLAGKFKGEC